MARAIAKGEIFCINVDDTTMKYDEMFDPDLREFYNADTFPAYILDLQEFRKKEVYQPVLLGTDCHTGTWHKDFQVAQNFCELVNN